MNAHSAAWVSDLGTFSLNELTATTTAAVALDHGEPIYYNHSGANIPATIHCLATYGGHQCNSEGMTVYIDPAEQVQNGDSSGQDDHLAIVDPAAGYEYDFIGIEQWPPQNGVLNTNWAGRCNLSGNGFTNTSYSGPRWNAGCGSQASGTPLSMGLIRAKDLLAAVNNPTGSLPQAIAFGIQCPGTSSGSLPAPFLGSGDGRCSGAPLEGERLYLAMHDADVNALGTTPIVAVILRTLDEDHYGAYLTNTGGSESGMQLNYESDSTYTAWGQPGPWLTQFIPEAQSEGLPGAGSMYQGRYQVGLPIPSGVAAAVRFL